MQGNSFHGSRMACINWLSNRNEGQFEVKPYKEKPKKRSLDANAYYWVLLDQLADVLGLARDDLHKEMLHDFGTWEYNADGSPKWVILPKNEPLPKDGYFYDMGADVSVKGENSGDEMGHAYIIIRGSHTYNPKEMSRLINGLVQECRQQGIETMTPAEIEEMCRDLGERK